MQVTVVSFAREPLATMLRFVAWHRAMGATQQRLYLDPDDPAFPYLSVLPDVTTIRCDAAFWAGFGLNSDSEFRQRQIAALTHGYRAVTEGWVAVLDADELFWFNGRSFGDVLSLDGDVRSIRVLTAELVHHANPLSGQTHFRNALTVGQCSAVYGADAFLLRRTNGLVGHREGKSITRAGLGIRRMRPHFAALARHTLGTDVIWSGIEGAHLLHFLNDGFENWRSKLDRRLRGNGIRPRMKAAIQKILATDTPEPALRAFFAAVHGIDDETLARLHGMQAHLRLDIDFDAPARALFGPLSVT